MKLFSVTSKGEKQLLENITSFELTSSADSACEGLKLYSNLPFSPEIHLILAYSDENELLFSGIADTITEEHSKSGTSAFLYARGLGALLADNEALPAEYHAPTARSLWYSNARPFGITYSLPEISAAGSTYTVSKGTCCFDAVNTFVSALTGSSIYVSPRGELKLHTPSCKVISLNSLNPLSVKLLTNPGDVLSDVSYKITSAGSYNRHYTSALAKDAGITRRRYYNLQSLPAWQRDITAKQTLEQSLRSYRTATAVLPGILPLHLYTRFSVEGIGTMLLTGLTYTENPKGATTRLTLAADDIGEIFNYEA